MSSIRREQQSLGPRAHNLAGQTSLRELMAVLSHCRVLLTNDSVPSLQSLYQDARHYDRGCAA